ncbi:MAG: O-antigen ligase family protein [Proteobacteria bacterium]|nr:O-antigen ligase family protein [Pseudomonadota bacterium]MCP4921118.1 O-antigen ligase family protein [Pseudomonadota bacterium]
MSALAGLARLRRIRWTTVVALLVVQGILAVMMVFDWRLPVALVAGAAVVVVALRQPLVAVGLLIAGRLISTGSMAFLRIGKINIGLFEPVLLLALIALAVHAVTRQQKLLHSWPWRAPLLGLAAFQVLGLLWCVSLGGGLQELMAVGVIFCTTTIILSYVKTYSDFRLVLTAWLAAAVVIGLLAVTTDWTGVGDVKDTWEVAAGGGRETGLGQQPNWFAMNLMFIVLTALGMAVVEERKWLRWLFVGAAFFVFVSQLRSGSRGGIYALTIACGLVGLAHPVARRWVARGGLVAFLLFAAFTLFGEGGSTTKAVNRIVMNLGTTWGEDIRQQNWLVCLEMFAETWGRGIGPGGYEDLVADYNWRIYDSIHKYPHGIFWGITAHYGVIGIGLFGAMAVAVVRMARDLVRWTKGSAIEVFAWTMPATMLGYALWSFVEFNFDDKPFWEFLALFTALWLCVKRMRAEGEAMPALPADIA